MKILIVFIICSLFCSCSGLKKDYSNKELVLIQLDPDKKRKLYLSEIVDSISVIQLETSSQSLLTDISKIDYDDEYYFVLNSRDKLVYKFDKNGKFESQIAKKGVGPGEIMYPQCFALDKMNKEVWMTNNNSFYRYSYQGDYLGNRPYSLAFGDFVMKENGEIYFYTGKTNNAHIQDGFLTGSITMLGLNNEKQTWFKSEASLRTKPNESVMSYSTRTPFTEQENGSITCHYVFSDTIYSINNDRISPSYIIDLGVNKSKIDLDQISGEDVEEYIQTHSNTVWYVRDVVETPTILRFSYNFGFESYANVYYNKISNHLLEGMPINDLLGGYIGMLGNHGNKFIGYISAADVKLETKLSSFISQEQLLELKKLTPESNPLLVEFTLKDF